MYAQAKQKLQIFVLDANPTVLEYVQSILADRFSVTLFTRADELTRSLSQLPNPDLLLMEWRKRDKGSEQGAQELLSQIRLAKPALPVVILACSTDLKEAVIAARAGADDVLPKPFRKNDIETVVQKHLIDFGEVGVEDDQQVREIPLDEDISFVISCKRMRDIEFQCRLIARTDIPVLILGESGTGKEVATKFIHKMSARRQRDFLKVNCAAMPAELLESELFGYEQGAFTGAIKSKPGKFELCNGGTIFLDEIGEMPAGLQAKLLQVLQDGSFSRLGGRNVVKVDVRVIAATNVDIKSALAQKKFREDLYYRLNGFTLKMPALRERMEEIPILAYHFVRKVGAKCGCSPLPISPTLMRALCNHAWPGNLRELENTIKRYLILRDERAIIGELTPSFASGSFVPAGGGPERVAGLKNMVRNLKGDAESVAIVQALEDQGWNRKLAASELKISYKALLYKIKQYNLTPPQKRYPVTLTAEKYAVSVSAVA
ncbi:MAG: sigma-54-dependent transcriptional regulator [Terracidiphilus sp.]